MEKKEVKTKTKTKTSKLKVVTKTKDDTKTKPSVKPKADTKLRASSKLNKKASTAKFYATGKRKTAVAKIWMMKEGSGRIIINGKTLTEYFQRPLYKMIITQPLNVLKVKNIYDIHCKVLGGGLSGQAGAIRHGISKVLNQVNEEFRQILRNSGFLTRDSRKVERKKYGQPKARKKFQFSKR